MPAKSNKQQMAMGAALACKRGKGKCKGPSAKIAKSMTEAQLKDFAETKRKGLPTRRKKKRK